MPRARAGPIRRQKRQILIRGLDDLRGFAVLDGMEPAGIEQAAHRGRAGIGCGGKAPDRQKWGVEIGGNVGHADGLRD